MTTGQTIHSEIPKSFCELYTPQPGDWIPHWPVVLQTAGSVIVTTQCYAVLPGTAVLIPEDCRIADIKIIRLALELPPVWIRKET
jgi:hypothetical protein